MAALVLASGFFSGSETALFYLSRDDLRRMRTGRSSERLAAALLAKPDRLLTAVLFWNLLINLAFFAVSLVTARQLAEAGMPTAAGVVSVASLVAIILFGEVAPKSLAVLFSRRLSAWVSWPLAIAVRVLDPVIPLLSTVTSGIRRAIWPNLKFEPYLQVDDIERAVETSTLGVELARLERDILRQILELADITTEEVMRPRGSVTVWTPPVSRDEVLDQLTTLEHVLLRSAEDDVVTGAIPLRALTHIPKQNLEKFADRVIYVPWCATLADTLASLRREVVDVAVIINEYGEMLGVLTEDDIFDTILNPHWSRARRLLRREPIVEVSTGRYLVDGLTTLRYLAKRFSIDYESPPDGQVTVAGLLQEILERLPQVGDEVEWLGFRLEVIETSPRGGPLRVSLTAPYAPPQAAASE